MKKALAAATAKFFSEKKKLKKNALKNSSDKIVQKKIAEKWCPR